MSSWMASPSDIMQWRIQDLQTGRGQGRNAAGAKGCGVWGGVSPSHWGGIWGEGDQINMLVQYYYDPSEIGEINFIQKKKKKEISERLGIHQ